MTEARSEMLERLADLVKKNRKAYRAAMRDFRRQFTIKSPEQLAEEEKV